MSEAAPVTLREMRVEELILIETIHAAAFDRVDEAQLPEKIMAGGTETLSVVAEAEGFLIAHALFSRLEGAERALALGPVAVAPDRQGQGVGAGLIRYGLDLAAERGWRSVFVLGDPSYYGRFGFSAELAAAAEVPWPGPAFQAIELVPGALEGWRGPLIYPDAFSALPG